MNPRTKNIVTIFTVAFLTLPLLTKAQASSSPSQSLLVFKVGSTGVPVAALQRMLIKQGYLKSNVTGYFGSETQGALESWEKAQNLPISGSVAVGANSLTPFLSAQASPFNSVKIGATGSQVDDIQSFFMKLGYLKIDAPTGYFGSLTQAAIVSFQKAKNIPETGVIDAATFAAMNGK